MLDDVDRNILGHLVENARRSLKELGKRVGLSSPSVSERLRRLEERGVIRSFTIDIDPRAIGYSFQAIIRVKPLPGCVQQVQKLILETPEFSDCDRVTGEDCFIVRAHLHTIEQLDELLGRVADKAETNSSIVKSQTFKHRLPPV
jgi:Lrp/AsnC family leucine-responsive transcriptional regulator